MERKSTLVTSTGIDANRGHKVQKIIADFVKKIKKIFTAPICGYTVLKKTLH